MLNKQKIVLASNNQGKLRELQTYFSDYYADIITQSSIGISPVEETGESFLANALQKARHAASFSDYPVIADDSGLIVDCLDGKPGIYSARYAGLNSSDQKNIDLLLREMRNENERQARFHCCLIYLRSYHDKEPIIISGEWSGLICREQTGQKGFGYDPVFFVPELQLTAAELSVELKNKYSHRGKANKQLVEALLSKKLIFKNTFD